MKISFPINDFGRRLAILREAKGLDRQELAKLLGTAKSNITHYEKNRHKPKFEQIVKLKEILNISYELLLEGKGETTL